MNVMANGQLYRLLVTGRSRDHKQVIKSEYLMVGLSVEDVKIKFPHVVDISDFASYGFDFVVKEPDRFYLLKTKIRNTVEAAPSVIIKRDGGTAAIPQAEVPAKRFSVHAAGVVTAKNENSAIHKIANRMVDKNSGIAIVVEEVFGGDGYAKPKDVSIFPVASFVRG